MPWIRKKAWYILTHQLTKISIVPTDNTCSAHSEYTDTEIEVWANAYETRLDYAVIHEILHMILDEYWEHLFSYHVYEYFIESLEKPFFKRMTNAEKNKWQNAIRRKVRRVDLKTQTKKK